MRSLWHAKQDVGVSLQVPVYDTRVGVGVFEFLKYFKVTYQVFR